MPTLTPRLVTRGADEAIAFYQRAFDAELIERYAEPDGHVVHAALALNGHVISLTEERPEWQLQAPSSLGGSPVLLNLIVDDADAVGRRMVDAGAKVVIEIDDRFYGHREGRFQDPFGHLWIITTITEQLTPEEIEARMKG